MDIMAQHLAHMRAGEPFLKPVYQHKDGTFGPLVRVDPKQFSIVDGLLGYYTAELRGSLRRAGLPRPAGGAAAQVEGAARLLAPRLHDRPGADRPRPARAGLGGVHPPAAAARRHRRLVPAQLERRSTSISTPSSCSVRPCATPTSGRCSTARPTRRAGSGSPRPAGRCKLSIPGRLDRDRAEAIEEMIWEGLPLREPPPLRAARRVHDRHRPAPLRVAGADPAADPLPPLHGDRERRARRHRDARAGVRDRRLACWGAATRPRRRPCRRARRRRAAAARGSRSRRARPRPRARRTRRGSRRSR